MTSRRALIRGMAALVAWAAGNTVPAMAGDDPPPPPAYGVKGEARTGSNIRPTVVTGSSRLPMNRRYDELTPEEQRRVRNLYEAMPEGDEPPFPANGLGPMYLALQQVASKDHDRGEWTFVVDVDAAGAPSGVALTRGEATEGTRRMATALMLMKFKPARCGGQPCAMSFPVRFRMERKL